MTNIVTRWPSSKKVMQIMLDDGNIDKKMKHRSSSRIFYNHTTKTGGKIKERRRKKKNYVNESVTREKAHENGEGITQIHHCFFHDNLLNGNILFA